jgi:RNA polymerase sigma-70 factor, ECF subfamily
LIFAGRKPTIVPVGADSKRGSMGSQPGDDAETSGLLARAGVGDPGALGDLFERHRPRLERLVRFRLDPRVRARIGASDVLQETYIELSRRIAEYLKGPTMPFYLWLRFLAVQKVLMLHRQHLGVKARSAGREVLLDDVGPRLSSAQIAGRFLDQKTTPTQAVLRAEMKAILEEALERMGPMDREILALRHFEQLANAEVARVLGIEEDAASKRYLRALRRLRGLLAGAAAGESG